MNISKIAQAVLYFVIVGIVGSMYYYSFLISPAATPEKAIRNYIISHGGLFQVNNIVIKETSIFDKNHGQQFIVGNYKIIFFYLKKSENGWNVTSAGTGP